MPEAKPTLLGRSYSRYGCRGFPVHFNYHALLLSFLLVFGRCLLFSVDVQGHRVVFAESDCLHTCSVLVFILISLTPSENNLCNLCMGPSLNLMLENHALALCWFHLFLAH